MLRDFKLLIGVDGMDVDQDDKLKWILESARTRLKLLLGGLEPPEEMNHIIVEVSVIRFNKIGSEGIKIHLVEGESNHFSDNDFDGFKDEIQAFLDSRKDASRGKVRFL